MTAATDEKRQTGTLLTRTFLPGDETAFKVLNEYWISRDFALEPADHEVLDNPKGMILDRGGEICIAEIDGEVVGCCALLSIAPAEYELAKMTVAQTARGQGVGRRLYLESNTKAAAAIHLYEELGFRHLAGAEHASKYARADTFMEMFL
jgi:putative acetyltransferase